MCYDLSFSSEIETIYDYLPGLRKQLDLDFTFKPTFHKQAQAYPKWPVILHDDKGGLKMVEMEWSIPPPPEATTMKRAMMGNATCEKLLNRYSFWYPLRHNRCLVPVTAFYEPHKVDGVKPSFWFYIKNKNRKMIFLPAVYDYPAHLANNDTGEITGTFSLITRPANSIMGKIHNNVREEGRFRMLLMLNETLEQEWLNPDLTDRDLQHIVEYCISPDELTYWLVDSPRKKDRPDDATLIEPAFSDKVNIEL